MVPTWTSFKTGTALIAVALISWTLSASDEPVKNVQQQTTTTRLTRTCTRAAGDAELIPWLSWSRIVHHTFHLRATLRQRCSHDGGVLPYMIHNKHSIACTQNQPSRVGVGGGATRVERAAHSPLPTRCQKKKNAFSDTASCRITLNTSTLCSQICGTGTSTICSIRARPPVLSA